MIVLLNNNLNSETLLIPNFIAVRVSGPEYGIVFPSSFGPHEFDMICTLAYLNKNAVPIL